MGQPKEKDEIEPGSSVLAFAGWAGDSNWDSLTGPYKSARAELIGPMFVVLDLVWVG